MNFAHRLQRSRAEAFELEERLLPLPGLGHLTLGCDGREGGKRCAAPRAVQAGQQAAGPAGRARAAEPTSGVPARSSSLALRASPLL